MTQLGYANVSRLLHCVTVNNALSLMHYKNYTRYIEEMTL